MRAVLFDVGNTLVHLDYGFLAAELAPWGAPTIEAVARADAEVRRHGWSRQGGVDGFFLAYFGAIALRLGLPRAAADHLGTRAAAAHRGREQGLWDQLDPDVPAVLERLRAAGLHLGVVSNADGRVDEQLQRWGLAHLFAVIVDSRVAGVAKPDPAIFHLALGRLGMRPTEAAHVGDILAVDVAGAEAAGLTGVLYDRQGVWRDVAVPRVERLGAVADLVLPAGGGR